MHDALYGDGGFYTTAGAPARNFRTAAHVSAQWAEAIALLAARIDDALDRPDGFTVVDMGAGGGELLSGLAALAPPRWRLVGVDRAGRPADLPARVRWSGGMPAGVDGLLIAAEWLDVVPVDVVEVGDDGPRLVEVSLTGAERLGARPAAADVAWAARWWPAQQVGDRAEIGRGRDAAWADATARLRRGAAVAVDYAAVPERDAAGTLTGFRRGRQLAPVPDGSMDLTAHVLLEACAAAATADETLLLTQREALRRLGVRATRPAYAGDPAAYAAAVTAAGEAAELLDPAGLGGFTWLVQTKAVPLPL